MFTYAQKPAKSAVMSARGILQRKSDSCRKKKSILERPTLEASQEMTPSTVHGVQQSSEQPVNPMTHTSIEPHLWHKFSQIPLYHKSPASIQAKLAVNTPGDIYEQEADRIADQVMATPMNNGVSSIPLLIQRFSGQSAGQLDSAPASVYRALASLGRPLEPGMRQGMEGRFGYDFSGVRVHTGPAAERSARDVNAKAYTVGQNIVFGTGWFAPGTHEGRRLVAHELAHVVQQSSRPVDGSPAMGGIKLSDPSDRFEQETELIPRRIVMGQSVTNRMRLGTTSTGRVPSLGLSVQRSDGSPSLPLKPPAYLGRYGASAVHVKGGIWDVDIPSLGGRVWVGPYDELSRYIAKQGFSGKMQAAHIVGGEHMADIGSTLPYGKQPSIAVDNSLHATWTKQTTELQKGWHGGRMTKTHERATVTRQDVTEFYDEIYRGHPELQEMSRNIVRSPTSTPAPAGGVGEGDSETAVVAPGGQGKPVAPPKTQGDVEPSSGTPPTATKASGGAGAQSEHESGETTPATGGARGASQVGLHIGLGAASVGLSLLAGYLKARVDAKIAQKQIDALLHVAGQRINAHPDEALKKMMFAPEVTTYAWVFLNSSVITFFEANTEPEPTTSDSAPMIDIDRIDYAYQPVDPSIPQNFLSGISGGGRHLTTTRTLIIDIPLVTPSVEDMFEYAKAHNIWLGGLRDYVMYRLQKSLANYQIAVSDLELHQGTQKDIDKAELQNRYWQDLADRILAAEKKQTASAR